MGLRIILGIFLALSLPASASAVGPMFGGMGAPACLKDVSQEVYAVDYGYAYDNQALGQSFIPSVSGRICKIVLRVANVVGAPENPIVLRTHTGEDLTTPTATSTGIDPSGWSADQKVEFIFPAGQDLNVTASTTYYFATNNSGTYSNRIEWHDNNSIYGDGNSYRATSSGWNLTGGDLTDDLYFEIYIEQ